uniref:Histone-lysine N-methyltransferase SETMAR n=1 Tax=Astyanax mexicanus TaxID=7994 RepID=A0A3B1KCF5_ASTMX
MHFGALFQQDNACPHTAELKRTSLEDTNTMPWPASSPDTCTTENVWDMASDHVYTWL